MNNPRSHTRSGWTLETGNAVLCWSLQVLLFVTVLCAFVPFSPTMPFGSADASWQMGLNQAVAQGLAFGRDIVFTYGPFASVYTKLYHPETDQFMLFGALYLALLYGLVLLLLVKNSKWYLLIGYWVVLAGLMYARSALYFSYPLLVGLFCFELIHSHRSTRLEEYKGLILVLVLFSPLGLMPLMKGSFAILCAAIAMLAFCLFLLSRKWTWAFAVVASTVCSMVSFWLVSGQSMLDLPSYFISMIPIVSGYSEAMSMDGSSREIACYILVGTLLLGVLLREKSATNLHRIYIFSVFFVYLFLAFKSGFVRHDYHAVAAATSLLMASLLVSMVFYSRLSLVVLILSIFSWIYIDSHAKNYSIERVARSIASTYSSAWNGIGERSKGNALLQKRFSKRLQQLEQKISFPLFEGTTDIYSYNQSYLIASGNRWNPRPIFQSYAAYAPELAQRNNNHLLGQKEPDNIIFSIEPIDKHMPSMEDGLSWFTILDRYAPSALENNFLYLHEKGGSQIDSQRSTRINEGTYSFGEDVPVPNDLPLVRTEISIEQNTLGKVVGFLFTSGSLKITLLLESGVSRTYRIVPGMAEAGFLVSPLIENTVQFGRLFGNIEALSDKKVQSFSIAPVGNARFWEGDFEVVFKNAAPPPAMDISKLYKFDAQLSGLEGREISVAEKCDGSIDSVNGTAPAPERFSATNILAVEGWLATSASEGLLPDSVFVVLKDETGVKTFIETRSKTHSWAARHFKKPELEFSGYTSTIDVSNLSGNYSLGLAFVEGNQLKICPQINIPATLEGMAF